MRTFFFSLDALCVYFPVFYYRFACTAYSIPAAASVHDSLASAYIFLFYLSIDLFFSFFFIFFLYFYYHHRAKYITVKEIYSFLYILLFVLMKKNFFYWIVCLSPFVDSTWKKGNFRISLGVLLSFAEFIQIFDDLTEK